MISITLQEPMLLSSFDDIAARVIAPEGSILEVVSPVYSGSVLLVGWMGEKWYVPNSGLVPSLDKREPREEKKEEASKSPWETSWRRGKRG